MPNADKAMLQIHSILAETERDFISVRTKAALQAAKERGTKLGGLWNLTAQRNTHSKALAESRAYELQEIVVPLRNSGASLKTIAQALNSAGIQTRQGRNFHPNTVKRILIRLKSEH